MWDTQSCKRSKRDWLCVVGVRCLSLSFTRTSSLFFFFCCYQWWCTRIHKHTRVRTHTFIQYKRTRCTEIPFEENSIFMGIWNTGSENKPSSCRSYPWRLMWLCANVVGNVWELAQKCAICMTAASDLCVSIVQRYDGGWQARGDEYAHGDGGSSNNSRKWRMNQLQKAKMKRNWNVLTAKMFYCLRNLWKHWARVELCWGE